MPEDDLSARLRAVERTLTDGDEVPDLSAAADAEKRLDALEAEMETLAERVDALDATVQSLHGYVGELEHVNDRVERRADAARAAVERLEGRGTPTKTTRGQTEDAGSTTDSAQADAVQPGRDGGKTRYSDEPKREHDNETKRDDETLFGRVRDAL